MVTKTKKREYLINKNIELFIHSLSFLKYASVNPDQYGVIIIAKVIVLIEKYLNAIWYGTTSIGPSIFAIIKLSVEKIIIPDSCIIKNIKPTPKISFKYSFFHRENLGLKSLYFVEKANKFNHIKIITGKAEKMTPKISNELSVVYFSNHNANKDNIEEKKLIFPSIEGFWSAV
jgi:hypothetical protein